MLETILFDLGDTLLHFGRTDLEATFRKGVNSAYEYVKGLGQPVPSLARYYRMHRWLIRVCVLYSRFRHRDFNALNALTWGAKRLGQELTPEQIDELCWCYYHHLADQARIEPKVADSLDELRAKGLKLGIISNTMIPGSSLDRHLAQCGLLEFFPMRIYSCEQGIRKPHRDIFRIALDRLGVRPEAAMYVGDRGWHDVFGANRVGLISVLIHNEVQNRWWGHLFRPRHTIESIADLVPLVDRIPGR